MFLNVSPVDSHHYLTELNRLFQAVSTLTFFNKFSIIALRSHTCSLLLSGYCHLWQWFGKMMSSVYNLNKLKLLLPPNCTQLKNIRQDTLFGRHQTLHITTNTPRHDAVTTKPPVCKWTVTWVKIYLPARQWTEAHSQCYKEKDNKMTSTVIVAEGASTKYWLKGAEKLMQSLDLHYIF